MTVALLLLLLGVVLLVASLHSFALARIIDDVQANRAPCEATRVCRRNSRREARAQWHNRPTGARFVSTRDGSLRISGGRVEFRAYGTWCTVWDSPSRRTTLVILRSPEEWNRDSDTTDLEETR